MDNCLDCINGFRLLSYIGNNTYREAIVCTYSFDFMDKESTLRECTCVQPELCVHYVERYKE